VRARFRRLVIAATIVNAIAMAAALGVGLQVRSRSGFVDVVTSRLGLLGVALMFVVLALTRLCAALDAAWRSRPQSGTALRAAATVLTSVLVVGGVAPLGVAADYAWQADRAVERVFSSSAAITAIPTPVPVTTTSVGVVDTTSTLAPANDAVDATLASPTTVAETTTIAPLVGLNRVNVLLVGGDAGPGRFGLRSDSMVVVSIDPTSGDTVMISVPRNLSRLPFPAGTPLADRYPNGFNDLANAVYPYVNRHRQLAGGGSDAGLQALKLGLAQLLGMPINYYVLVDMAGFVDVVDALGGVDLVVGKRVPAPGAPPKSKHPIPDWFEKGPQHMDGTLALAYARSRKADSDYQRMARQRCVLAAMATAATPGAVVAGLTDLLAAFGDAVRTDIPRERLGDFVQLIDRYSQAGGLAAVRTLQLTPPLVEPSRWSLVKVRALVAGVVEPAAVAPLPAEPSGGASEPTAPPVKILADACD
jgi:polyisoprenyl-teichoic acid--peptidoglycan teichoic acid transferase